MTTDSKNCRNCGSADFYAKEVTPADGACLLPVGPLHGPKYQIRVCGSCGLTEWFVPQRFLSLVREKFDRM